MSQFPFRPQAGLCAILLVSLSILVGCGDGSGSTAPTAASSGATAGRSSAPGSGTTPADNGAGSSAKKRGAPKRVEGESGRAKAGKQRQPPASRGQRGKSIQRLKEEVVRGAGGGSSQKTIDRVLKELKERAREQGVPLGSGGSVAKVLEKALGSH